MTATIQKIDATIPGCSLQEAIFSANLDDNKAISGYRRRPVDAYSFDPIWITTQCVKGNGDDVIVLPTGAVLDMGSIVDDAINPFGPTATPLITSTVTIEAHGALLQRVGTSNFRLFSVGSTGRLTLRNAHVKGFIAKGGDGGPGGGGGGLGAGGAIFVHAGEVFVEGTTFEGNGAVGGNGAGVNGHATGGGGGGGIGGNGGIGATFPNFDPSEDGGGGGGGGARGNGENGTGGDWGPGGGGGGTVKDGLIPFVWQSYGGFDCGGEAGGQPRPPYDGRAAPCEGGGGGGGGRNRFFGSGSGGPGSYGGGGGGGAKFGGNGANGGFGGGGGAGWEGTVFGSAGGNGGFGGGGGSGPGAAIDGNPGTGGRFAGNANARNGGGGGGLGGAIFNDEGKVYVLNSTFTGNYAHKGLGGGTTVAHAPNGEAAGGAIFSRNGQLTVQYTTVAGNEAHTFGAAIAVIEDGAPALFTLQNTILASNFANDGAPECFAEGNNIITSGNLITNNGNCGTPAFSTDPGLGPLQRNQGPTPTMAISRSSPAFDKADATVLDPRTSLPVATDQRGEDRPSEDGFDIGAFELCVEGLLDDPCLILDGTGTRETRKLTMSASPVEYGTTIPAPGGPYQRLFNTFVAVTAIPDPGYYLVNWTGGVTDPFSAFTTVLMNQDRDLTANFALIPDFTFSAIPALTMAVAGTQSTTVTVNANGAFNAAVALSSQVPAGFGAALNPASVTPSLGGAASSQLSLTLAPWLAPGKYTLTVRGESFNVLGALAHTVPVDVTVLASPAGIIDAINQNLALGCIDNPGIASAFTAKLQQAQRFIDAGDVQSAINALAALLHQLSAQSGKHISITCSDQDGNQFDPVQALIAQLEALLASLGASAAGANPVMGYALDPSGAGVAGATVNLTIDKTVIASATTDATGFFVFCKTSVLAMGATYNLKVTPPKPYKDATAPGFAWNGTTVTANSALK